MVSVNCYFVYFDAVHHKKISKLTVKYLNIYLKKIIVLMDDKY
jgi:hypothetical protein